MKPYLLFFEPVFKERIWGGTALKTQFGYSIPDEQTGEAWVISDHQNGRTVVRNGVLAGKTIGQLWKERREWFGAAHLEQFPLLVKLLDANKDLSVQVHPDDTYAALHENGGRGKTEAWLVLQAEPGAKIIYGHRAKDREEFQRMVEQGAWDAMLVEKTVETGDCYYVPGGTVHALGKGIVVLEIQQSSDTTYRIYDYERIGQDGRPRELHLEKALDVVAYGQSLHKTAPERYMAGTNEITRYIQSPYFTIEGWVIREPFQHATADDSFHLISVLDGEGIIRTEHEKVHIKKGDHFLIPAPMGDYQIGGSLEAVKVTV
jgi:mannose-6-phosphate isomerase